MSGFLKTKTKVSITLPLDKIKAEKVVEDLKVIVSYLNQSEINLLARAVTNPLIKNAAIRELKSTLD